MFDPFLGARQTLDEFAESSKLTVEDEPVAQKGNWLFDFCYDVCGHDKMAPQPHYKLTNELEDIVGDCQFKGKNRTALLIELPRGHFKTSVAGEDLPVGITVRNPNARGLITTHKDKTSSRRLEAIKNHFERNPIFIKRYGNDWKPEFREGAWSSKALVVARRTKVLREPTVEVAAVGADMTGSHYDYIICDDVVQRENVRNQEQRDKVYDYIQSLFSLLDPGGVLIIIGTRWHPDDAYGRIIDKDKEREDQGLEPLFKKYIRSCYDGPNGLLFPTEYGHEQLEDIRERIGPRNFAANYLNQPVADADRVFKSCYLREIDFTYLNLGPASGVVRYSVSEQQMQIPVSVTMAWDTAGTRQSAKSDYHGLTVVGTDADDSWWFLDAEQLKGTVSEVITRVTSLLLMYKPGKLIIDAVGSYQLWVDALQARLDVHNIRVEIVESRHRGIPKEERIAMLEPKWTNGDIIVRPDQLSFKAQTDNFSMINNLAHDDILDSASMHIGHTEPANSKGQTTTVNPLDQEALRRDKQRLQRNPVMNFLQRRRW